MSSASIAPPATSPVLSLLSRLALAIARRRAYGDAHPMVAQADEALSESLIEHIEAHSSFAIAVANRDLLVNGEVMPGNSAVVRDIATRLHLMGIGAVRFQRGLTIASLGTLIGLLARRTSEVAELAALPDLQGIIIGRLDYEQLGLADEATLRAEGDSLWQTLAARALEQLLGGVYTPEALGDRGTGNESHSISGNESGSVSGSERTTAPGATLSGALARAAADPRAAEAAFLVLSDIVDRVSMTPRTVRDTVGAQLDALFATLDDAALVALLRTAPPAARGRFTSTMVDLLPAAAIIRWLSVSAQANGRELSPHMLRIITKMSAHQAGRSPEAADQSLRETVLELIDGWEGAEPNPEEHHLLLDTLADWSAHDTQRRDDEDTVHLDPISHEAIRLVQMACEIDAVSDDTVQAVRHLADHGFSLQVLAWAEQAASEDTRRRLRDLAVTPRAIANTLLATPFDAVAAKQLLDGMPDAVVPLLIDPLEHCESRTGRRLIFDRLHAAGAAIEPALRERLTQPMPWYLARNLLGLLRDIAASRESAATEGADDAPASPPGPLLLLQSHEHVQVRREAVRVLALYAATRTAALRRALDDASGEVRLAAIEVILALRDANLPREIVSRLLAVADQESVETSTREKALRAAARSGHTEVRQWLLAHTTRRGLLKSIKLAPLTPLVRTALQQLAANFGEQPDVAPVLALARKDGVLAPAQPARARESMEAAR